MDELDSFNWKETATIAAGFNYVILAVALAYVPFTLLAQYWMSERPAFELVLPLKMWNCTLSFLSMVGFVLNLGYIRDVGFEASYSSVETYTRGQYGVVIFLFSLSKILELLDTAFIVLQKK